MVREWVVDKVSLGTGEEAQLHSRARKSSAAWLAGGKPPGPGSQPEVKVPTPRWGLSFFLWNVPLGSSPGVNPCLLPIPGGLRTPCIEGKWRLEPWSEEPSVLGNLVFVTLTNASLSLSFLICETMGLFEELSPYCSLDSGTLGRSIPMAGIL